MPHPRQQHACVGALEQAQRVRAPADLLGESVEVGLALGRGERGPRWERVQRGTGGRVRVLGGAFGDMAERALVDRATSSKVSSEKL